MRRFFTVFVASFVLFAVSGMLFSGCVMKEQGAPVQQEQKIELVYYKLFDQEDVINPLIQQYESDHPNVNITYRKFEDPVEYENLIINELAEGEGPDIFSAPNYWFLRNAKKLQPMPVDMMSPQVFDETFVSVATKDLVMTDANDGGLKVFGIPLTVDTLALYYNRAQFEDKIPERGRPATTWAQLQEDVFQLSKGDTSFERFEVAGIAMGRSDNIARSTDILLMLMLQYGAEFYNANVSKAQFATQRFTTAGGASINPALEALTLYTSFGLPANKNYSWNAYLANADSPEKELETFARGKVSMIFGYSYLYEQIRSKIAQLKATGVQTVDMANVRIAVVPQVEDPESSTDKRHAYANYFAETVSRTSAHPREAWDFLMFMGSRENLDFYNEKTKRPTSRRDLIEEHKQDPVYGVYAEQTGFAESVQIYDYVRYAEIFGEAVSGILATESPGDVLRRAENAINDLLPLEGLIPSTALNATSQ